METTKICPVCDHEIPADARFLCPHCHFELKWLNDSKQVESHKAYIQEKIIRGESEQETDSSQDPVTGFSTIATILFFTIGILIVLNAFSSGDWKLRFLVLLVISIFLIPIIRYTQNRHETLTRIWSSLASHAGLQFNQGQYQVFGSIPPSLSGNYRGRQISISKLVHSKWAYEGAIPVVYTRVIVNLNNDKERFLTITSKPLTKRKLKSMSSSNEKQQLGEHFKLDAHPDKFREKVTQLIARRQDLFDCKEDTIMITDYPFSWVSWSPPEINLEGSKLFCIQMGISINIAHQMQFLNLLCDLAELVETP